MEKSLILLFVLTVLVLVATGCSSDAEPINDEPIADTEVPTSISTPMPATPPAPTPSPTPTPTVSPTPTSSPSQTPTSTVPPLEPSEDWEIALVEFLMQFPPMFHNVRYEDHSWISYWISDWGDYVEELIVYWSEEWHQAEQLGYGYSYIFRDIMTGERLIADDVAYLNQRSGKWLDDDGTQHTWSQVEIAGHFDLLDLDGSGIPVLIIYWTPSPHDQPFGSTMLYHFNNGAFELGAVLSDWDSINFYRTEDGRVFVDRLSPVASMINMVLLHLSDEITTEPVLSTDGWTGTVHNHLTGEYFERYDGTHSELIGIEWRDSIEEFLSALIGEELMKIERMETVQIQFIEFVSQQLRADGRIP